MPRPTPLQRRRRRVLYALLLLVWAAIAWEWWAWAHPAPVPRPSPPRLAVAELRGGSVCCSGEGTYLFSTNQRLVMTHVFLLWHTQEEADLPGGEDVKLLGVYSSQQQAEEALNASVTLPGFRDQPAGFLIAPYELNKRAWTGGCSMV